MNKRRIFCDLTNFFQCELFWGRGVRLGRVGQTRMPSGDGSDLLGDKDVLGDCEAGDGPKAADTLLCLACSPCGLVSGTSLPISSERGLLGWVPVPCGPF